MSSVITEASTGSTVEPDINAVRNFVAGEIVPRAEQFDQDEHIPSDVLQRLSQLGIWAPFLPKEYGGSDTTMSTLGRIHEEIGRGCSSVRSLLTVHTMVSWSIHRWGTDAQRTRWLPSLAAGEITGAFCLTEPSNGSDASAADTPVRAVESGWLINGTKKWITGGQIAGLFLLFGQTNSGMSAFLVPRNTPGISVTPITGALGTKGSMLAEITFTDVVVDKDALLGPQGWAAGTVMTGALDLGRYSVACGSVGIIQACLDACTSYATQRHVRDGYLKDLPLIRQKITDMLTSSRAARLLCSEAGRLKDAGDPSTIMATWIAKYHASTSAAKAASDAVQIHGANGCSTEYPVARLYRDAKIMEIIEGSNELQQMTIADEAFREAATQ